MISPSVGMKNGWMIILVFHLMIIFYFLPAEPAYANDTLLVQQAESHLGTWDFEKALKLFQHLADKKKISSGIRARAVRGRFLTRALIFTEYRSLAVSVPDIYQDAAKLIPKGPDYFDVYCANRLNTVLHLDENPDKASEFIGLLEENRKKYNRCDYHLIRRYLIDMKSQALPGEEKCHLAQEEGEKAIKADPDCFMAWEIYLDVLWGRGKTMSWIDKIRFEKMIRKALSENREGLKVSPFKLYFLYQCNEKGGREYNAAPALERAMNRFPRDPLIRYEYLKSISGPIPAERMIFFLEDYCNKFSKGQFVFSDLSRMRLPISCMYKLGDAYFESGDVEKALETYEDLQEYSPHYAQVHLNKSICLKKMADKEERSPRKKDLLNQALQEIRLYHKYLFQNRDLEQSEKIEKFLEEALKEFS